MYRQRTILWDPLQGKYRYATRLEEDGLRSPSSSNRKTWSKRKRDQIAYRDGVWCYLCEEEYELDELTIDHVIPLASGGTNDNSNLKLACYSCNNAKGDMSLEEFLRSRDA